MAWYYCQGVVEGFPGRVMTVGWAPTRKSSLPIGQKSFNYMEKGMWPTMEFLFPFLNDLIRVFAAQLLKLWAHKKVFLMSWAPMAWTAKTSYLYSAALQHSWGRTPLWNILIDVGFDLYIIQIEKHKALAWVFNRWAARLN